MTSEQRGALFLIVLVIFVVVSFSVFSVIFKKDMKTAQAVAAGKKPISAVRERILKAVSGTLMVDKWGNVLRVEDAVYPGGKVLYSSSPGSTADMDERLLNEKIAKVVYENDSEYKNLAVSFINKRKVQ